MMKRTLTVIMIALVAITGIFAASAINETGEATVSFALSQSDIEAAKTGFAQAAPSDIATNKKDVAADVGSPRDSISLTYSSVTDTAKNSTPESEIWYYFKVKALNAPTITLSGTQLTGYDKRIDFTASVTDVVGGEVNGTINTADGEVSTITITPTMLNGFGAGYGKITIETMVLNASFALGAEKTYNGKLTMTVVGA